MDKRRLVPRTPEERLVWYAIVGTYVFYALGALYIVAPVLGWCLLLLAIRNRFLTPGGLRAPVPIGILIWIAGMLAMEVALLAGHLDFELGLPTTIKSTIGWAKGWALMAIFPYLGAVLDIRPGLIFRATTLVCIQTLLLVPLFLAAYFLNLSQELYVSPLRAVGGPGPEFFSVTLYGLEGGAGEVRWRFFTPWAPAAGFIANVYFLFALQERERKYMVAGIVGCIVIVLMCKSRLALISMLSIPIMIWGLSRLTRPSVLYLGATGTLVMGLIAPQLIDFSEAFQARFVAARAASSRVRSALGRIALNRWQREAPLWGHGIVERGPHLVEYMPIGSHHSWYGLLFVKGIVGFVALALPMLWSFVELLIKAQSSRLATVGLGMVLILFLYTFGENLEILSYLYWPGLVVLGMAHREPFGNPLRLGPPAHVGKGSRRM